MTQREREALASTPVDPDPHSLLFGFGDEHTGEFEPVRMTRADRRRSEQSRGKRARRRGRFFVLLTVLIVAVVAAVVGPRVKDYFTSADAADYAGSGTGTATIVVHTGDNAEVIGEALLKADVVKSVAAFTQAADADSKSTTIQPGTYTLHQQMSAKAALGALLDPASRSPANVVLVTEGARSKDVRDKLIKTLGAAQQGAIDKALASPSSLNIPVSYTVGGKAPTSVEGFEYPATYNFDPGTTPQDALVKMVSRFIQQDRATGFASTASKVGLTPYQALIVASMAQSEAKYAADMPKVVRTILNRIKFGIALKFDSTSSYACTLQNVPATKCIYHQVDSPYNTYTHKGLPPTPIDNPGAQAMNAAVHPAPGNWVFFVNKDKAGHLFFTNSETAFTKAAAKCARNNWGCG